MGLLKRWGLVFELVQRCEPSISALMSPATFFPGLVPEEDSDDEIDMGAMAENNDIEW